MVGEVLLMVLRLEVWGAGRLGMGGRVWRVSVWLWHQGELEGAGGLPTGGPSRRWSEVP